MSLFKNYSNILYPLVDENGVEKVYNFVDIMTRVKMAMTEDEILKLTQPYELDENETPEVISYKVYGSQAYYWTILFVNGLYDYIGDWYMDEAQLQKFCEVKYGSTHVDDSIHVVDEYGIVRKNPDPDLALIQNNSTHVKYEKNLQTMSNFTWESMHNFPKKKIRIIVPSRILDFVRLFNETITA